MILGGPIEQHIDRNFGGPPIPLNNIVISEFSWIFDFLNSKSKKFNFFQMESIKIFEKKSKFFSS